MSQPVTRRTLLRTTALGGAGLLVLRNAASARTYQANEKVNVALVGVGGRGTWFVDQIPRMEQVVALCDVNDNKVAEAFKRWDDGTKKADAPEPWERAAAASYQRLLDNRPKVYRDFRVMFDELGDGVDAVVVATPDHTHAVITAAALRRDKAVFCEKPLTRTVGEARALRELAREHYDAVTAMGNQGTYSGPFRRAVELIRGGTLGDIQELHVWNTGGGADKQAPPQGEPPVPAHLAWDLWLGPAAARPYHPEWMNRNAWRELGTCQLGNWAPHTANLGFMALNIARAWHPDERVDQIVVEAEHSGLNKLSFPKWEVVKWRVPARAGLPPITINWYNGDSPASREVRSRALVGMAEKDRGNWEWAGTLVVGTNGMIHTTGHNMSFRLLPAEAFEGVQTGRPETLEASRGPEQDFFAAVRGGKHPWSHFDYASPLIEFLMLGNVATQVAGPIEYDPISMKITNSDEADKLLHAEYRERWSL